MGKGYAGTQGGWGLWETHDAACGLVSARAHQAAQVRLLAVKRNSFLQWLSSLERTST